MPSPLDLTHPNSSNESSALTLDNPIEKLGDPTDMAGSISTTVGITILVLIFLIVVLERRHANQTVINFLRIFSLLIFPLFILPFASFATFEGSQKVEFCQTCHTAMDLYVDDLKDKSSLTLAAIHYNNRYIQENHCYSCHAGYRVLDIGKAKATGLIHLYYWITKSPTAMGEEQIKLYGTAGYQNEYCLNCHSGAQGFLESGEGIHKIIKDDLLAKDPITGESKMSCLLCHGPAHLSLAERKSPKIFVGKGLVTGQPGVNQYPSQKAGESFNGDRPYENAPPPIPHIVDGYKITRTSNTCLERCHLKGLEQIPSSHTINEHTGEQKPSGQVIGIRYNCLQCHLPQSSENPPVSQQKHFQVVKPKIKTASLVSLTGFLNSDKKYVGVAICRLCHQSSESGSQYEIWKKNNHSRAYRDLASKKGKKIARFMNVSGDPQKSEKCLICHTTGYGTELKTGEQIDRADGVQCEQCHGPGSEYMKLVTMKMIKKGDIKPEAVGLAKPDTSLCLKCHSPNHEHIGLFDPEKRFKKIAHWRERG